MAAVDRQIDESKVAGLIVTDGYCSIGLVHYQKIRMLLEFLLRERRTNGADKSRERDFEAFIFDSHSRGYLVS